MSLLVQDYSIVRHKKCQFVTSVWNYTNFKETIITVNDKTTYDKHQIFTTTFNILGCFVRDVLGKKYKNIHYGLKTLTVLELLSLRIDLLYCNSGDEL